MAPRFRVIPLLLVFLFSCSEKVYQVEREIEKAQKELQEQKGEAQVPRASPPPPPILPPTYEEISPLEGKEFTMSAASAPLAQVLYAIAEGVGLNLILSPEVDASKPVTATFNKVPVKEALDVIMDMTGLYYEVRGNVLYVKEFVTKTFNLPYVHTLTDYSSSLGGDVLGGTLTTGATTGVGGASGLKGSFSLQYKNPQGINDFYTQVEENLKSILSQDGKYVLNRFTGTLVVTDRRRNVEKVEEFIRRLRREIGKQVLIEAKIVEIALSDEFQYGIDWNAFFTNVFGSGANVTFTQNLSIPTGGFASVSVVSSDFTALINALGRYGKVYTLSNPRIMVSNGQSALIATGIVTPFFERQVVTTTGTTTTQLQENIVRTNVLEGVLLGVTPYVDDRGEIVLNIVPVSTRLEGTKTLQKDGQVLAEAPILNVKESGTVVKVRNNELIIIGGLMGEVKGVEERKVPGLGDIPLLGYLFKSKRLYKEKRELIIFLKPQIVQGGI